MGVSVVIADDAGFIRQMLIRICEEGGHKVVAEASNGEDAIKLALQWVPQVVIMDLVMPKKNGLQAISTVIEENRHTKYIICSSVDEMDFVQAALDHPDIIFLAKPFTREQVLKAIDDLTRVKEEKRHA